jgi:DNA-binding NarL/FixJ family response regulator
LSSLLRLEQGFEVVGLASSVQDAVEQTMTHRPDVVLMSTNLVGGDALEALRQVAVGAPECQVVMLTSQASDEEMIDVFRAGAKGYAPKSMPLAHLTAALRGLSRGQVVLSRDHTQRLIAHLRAGSGSWEAQPPALDQLTRRELEVWQLLADGATNGEIAARLVISENTVRIHVRNVLDKLNLRHRREAAHFAHGQQRQIPWVAT